MSDSRQMMYFQFMSGETQLTFALGSRSTGGEQPQAIGAGAAGQGTSGAIKRAACGRNCGSSIASMSSMSDSRNSTMALMPPPRTSQMNKSTACPGGRTICQSSCAAACNKTRNTSVLGRSVSAAPPNYQSFKAPHSNNSTMTNTTAQLNSTRKESLSSTMLPMYEPTIIAGNTSVSKPCNLPNATGINASAYNQTLSRTYINKTKFNNVTANSTRRQ